MSARADVRRAARASPSTVGTADRARACRARRRAVALSFGSREPLVAARGDRVVLRAATTVGGGRVIDPSPPRHASAERMERVERGAIAATVHEPVRAESLAPSRRARRRRAPTAGCSRAAWLDELPAELERRIGGSLDPLDPGVPPPSEPWAAAVAPLLATRAARREALPPGRDRRARRARRGRRRARGAARARAGEGRGRRARALSRGEGAARPRRRRLRGLHGRLRARATRSSPSASPPAGSRSRASATCSASGGRRRSCCSSASTRTGSRAASATSASCADVGQSPDECDEVTELIDRYNDAWNRAGRRRDPRAAPSGDRLRQPHRRRAGGRRRRRARAHRPRSSEQPRHALRDASFQAGEDFAVCEWTLNVTKDGRPLEWDGVDVFPLRDGLIARKDVYSTSHRPRELTG